jgi:hypothetical protein
MEYQEGELLIKITGLPETAGKLGLESLDKLSQVDAYRHLNQLCALFEELGIDYDEMKEFYDDLAQTIKDEYFRLPCQDEYPELSLSAYDRWIREIIEATHIAHSHYHENRLAQLQALETSSGNFVNKVLKPVSGDENESES